jgi:hydroxyethylthiazole kinase-like uncharacterized protein yjeF
LAELEPLYTADELRAAEAGRDVDELMRRAARGLADFVLARFPEAQRISAVCGGGNNGGDARVAAQLLVEAGKDVLVVETQPDDEPKELGAPQLVVDGIFGTGFSGEPRPAAARLIEQVNGLGAPVVAVDVPSGVDASTGEIGGAAVRAAATVAFHGRKVGSAVAPGSLVSGDLHVVDIGLAAQETGHALVGPEVARRVPQRARDGNKYTSGSVLVVGGSPGMTGAACLAAEAAFRADAGYVCVCAPPESLPVLETRLLEAVKRPLEDALEAAQRATALAIGPGLGRDPEAADLVRRLIAETDIPAVADADALFRLEPATRSAPLVLTPHSGELARLLSTDAAWVDAHRLEAVAHAVERYGCVVLLKGSETIVAARGARTLVVEGTPRLATAGTGDVLTGILGAFLAKGMDAHLAAATAARVHADAARSLPHERGIVASDVAGAVPGILSEAPVQRLGRA